MAVTNVADPVGVNVVAVVFVVTDVTVVLCFENKLQRDITS